MIDQLFIEDAPAWLNLHYEMLVKEITTKLAAESQCYRKYLKKMDELYDLHPKIVEIMEYSKNLSEMVFSTEEIMALAELIQLENEVSELYQRMLYIKGIRNGVLLSMYSDITKE